MRQAQEQRHRIAVPAALILGALSGILGQACGGADQNRPPRKVTVEPAFIDFDAVSISGQRTLNLSIHVEGDELDITNASTSSGKFRFQIPEELRRGLANGETGQMQVLYRPCPQAWKDDELIPDFDYSKCSRRADEGRLRLVDGRYGWSMEVALLGRPAESGRLEIACAVSPGSCDAADTNLVTPCEQIDFGMVSNGGMCETVLEFRNTAEANSAPIYINALSLSVAGAEKGEVFDGTAVGFSGLPTEAFSIEAGMSKTVRLGFQPQIKGVWRGSAEDGLGLSVFTNSPTDQPEHMITVAAMSSAPRLEVYPAVLNVPRKAPGNREILMVTLSNSGNEMLSITELLVSASHPIAVADAGPFDIEPGASREVELVYTGSEQTFQSELIVVSTDPNQSRMTVSVKIEPVPKLCVDPVPLLEIIGEVGDLRFSNCGDGELKILELELIRSNASNSHNSFDDFLVEGCSGGRCQPGISLCSASAAGCRISSTVFHVVYDNRDNSPFDLAALVVRTNDPDSPETTITLKGIDGNNGE